MQNLNATIMKKRSVFNLGDFKNPQKIHEDMLAAQADFNRIISNNKPIHVLAKEIKSYE